MKKTIFEGDFSLGGKPLADQQLSLSGKAPYEAPVTTRTLVETEGSFCGSIVPDEPDTSQQNIEITPQEFGGMSVYDEHVDKETGETIPESGWDF